MKPFLKRGFASDNNSGIHPSIFDAIANANQGHVIAYGDDYFTNRAVETFKSTFGDDIKVFFVLTGTGANVLGLASMTNPYHAVVCPETAHIHVDECGAPERFCNCKLLAVDTPDGKLTPERINRHLHGFGFEHHVQPRVISISQPTELGTVYTPDEIRSLSVLAKDHDMFLHMDGARLANAAVSLDLDFKDFTRDSGVDVLSFGGTKNGMLFGESVVFFNDELADHFKYTRKQGMQLASKMRFVAVQFDTYLKDNIWRTSASHANRMAQLLYHKVSDLPEVRITQRVETNCIFATVPKEIIKPLQDKYYFYVWNETQNEVRWMTSYDTEYEDIENFVHTLGTLLRKTKINNS